MKKIPGFVLSGLLLLSAGTQAAVSPEVTQLQTQWAHIKYQLPQDQREQAFEKLAQQAQQIADAQPDSAEAKIWEAIILASNAGERGGLGALSLVKRARELLLEAEKLDATALDGSMYTSLGSLYYQVPGWPLGFGNDGKAREYLGKALQINPEGIDANYFYADFLMDQGDYQGAVVAFEKALQAPDRPDRPVADMGRRQEIQQGLEQARKKL
ncbi:MAG: hypothetical protein PVG66_08065 [Chromatiales bacterium]|jgi:tetratricopeptide (TPR) repeat protein